MKVKIFFISLFLIGGMMAKAQNDPPRRTVEERVKMVMEKLTPGLNLDKDQQSKTDSTFADYYRSMNKIREGLPAGERPDRAVMDKLRTERDEKLKTIFKEEQFKKFKDEIEPSLRQGGNRPANQ